MTPGAGGVTVDRNQLEAEALRALDRGNIDGALAAYQQILRSEPRDRRVKQKVAELLVRQGKTVEAERHLRELAEGHVKEGAHRAAIALLRQIVGFRPDDASLHMEMGECLAATGNVNDARTSWDQAMRLWIGAGSPGEAVRAARRLSESAPTEMALRMRVAELLEASGDGEGAVKVYLEVAADHRRRGRPDEVGRVAEMALRLRPGDLDLLRDAARARLDAEDARGALLHLQGAFQQAAEDPQTLDLLARAFEAAGQPEKALRVLGELARVSDRAGDLEAEADAVRRSAKLDPNNAGLATRLSGLDDRRVRLARRFTDLAGAAPRDEVELRAVVRTEVYVRVGFHDRAERTIGAALAERPTSAALLAAQAEALIAADRRADGLVVAATLAGQVTGADAAAVTERIQLLGGDAGAAAAAAPAAAPGVVTPEAPAAAPAAPASVASAPSAPAGTPVAAGAETAEARGDRLAAAGDVMGAVMAYREVLAANPQDTGVLEKIAALRNARSAAAASPAPVAAAPPVPVPVPVAAAPAASATKATAGMGSFVAGGAKPAPAGGGAPVFRADDHVYAEISPDELDDLDDSAFAALEGPDLEEVRGLLAVGVHDEALDLLEGAEGLEAAVLRAEAHRGKGEIARALDGLKEAVAEAAEREVAYPAALFELAGLYTSTAKHRLALRTLEELRDLAPEYRVAEVDARLRGLQRLLK